MAKRRFNRPLQLTSFMHVPNAVPEVSVEKEGAHIHWSRGLPEWQHQRIGLPWRLHPVPAMSRWTLGDECPSAINCVTS